MAELQLISIELRFKTREEPGPLADRIRGPGPQSG